jgi:hypothetical protein
LRYEIDPPAHDKYGRMMNFVPSVGKIIVPSGASGGHAPQRRHRV